MFGWRDSPLAELNVVVEFPNVEAVDVVKVVVVVTPFPLIVVLSQFMLVVRTNMSYCIWLTVYVTVSVVMDSASQLATLMFPPLLVLSVGILALATVMVCTHTAACAVGVLVLLVMVHVIPMPSCESSGRAKVDGPCVTVTGLDAHTVTLGSANSQDMAYTVPTALARVVIGVPK
jgi:hypothetical protein